MTSVLKAPGTNHLKLGYDNQLSNYAFKFNLRCYTTVGRSKRKRVEPRVGL